MPREPLARALHQLRRLLGAAPPEGASDAELLDRFVRARDEGAFALLMRRHGPAVLAVCRRLLADPHAAEDAFQATFLVLVRRAASLRREGSLGGWLHGVATRVALKARATAARRRGREVPPTPEEEAPVAVAPLTDVPDQAARRELRELLDVEVSRLPEKYRAPLVLCYLEGRTNEEAARELGCPTGSMSWLLSQARERLRSRLSRRGVALTAVALGLYLGEQTATAAVPAVLGETTLRAAALLAAGESAAGIVSVNAAALAEGTAHALAAARWQWAAAVLLGAVLLGGGGALAYRGFSGKPDEPATAPAPEDLSAWVEDRVNQWQPNAAERAIDRIGWARDVQSALDLAKKHNRPVFLFTHAGSIFTGRCGGSAFHLRGRIFIDERLIALLNRSFVPVCSDNDDFEKGGPGSAEDRRVRERVYHTALESKMHAGTDCIYLLAPDGRLVDSVSVKAAKKVDDLLARLQEVVKKLETDSGEPVVAPAAQSTPPAAPADALVLHLTARVFGRTAWHEFPSENWIVLPPDRWARLLPSELTPGTRHDIDPEVAAGLLTYFYPQTENNDLTTNQIVRHHLRGEVIGARDGVARVRLDGELRMKHTFYGRPDDYHVDAAVTGFVDVDVTSRRVRALRLVTRQATYGPWQFGVAVRSVP